MSNDELVQKLFDYFSLEGEVFDDEWFESFITERQLMEILWDNETDSGNPACGDESEILFQCGGDDGCPHVYGIRTTFKGVVGPFATENEAIIELGYDPEFFPPYQKPEEEEE